MPSIHTLLSWLCIIAIRMDKKMPITAKIIIAFLAIGIIISTQTIKQHYIIDSIVGLALAELAYWTLRNSKIVNIFSNNITKFNQKLKIE